MLWLGFGATIRVNRPLMALPLPPKLLRLLARSPLATDNSSSRFPAPDVSPVSVLSQLAPATGKPAHNSTSNAGTSFYFVLYMQLHNFGLKGLTNTVTHHISTINIRIEKKDHRRLTRNDYESQLFWVLGLPFPGHSKALPASAVNPEHRPIWTRMEVSSDLLEASCAIHASCRLCALQPLRSAEPRPKPSMAHENLVFQVCLRRTLLARMGDYCLLLACFWVYVNIPTVSSGSDPQPWRLLGGEAALHSPIALRRLAWTLPYAQLG